MELGVTNKANTRFYIGLGVTNKANTRFYIGLGVTNKADTMLTWEWFTKLIPHWTRWVKKLILYWTESDLQSWCHMRWWGKWAEVWTSPGPWYAVGVHSWTHRWPTLHLSSEWNRGVVYFQTLSRSFDKFFKGKRIYLLPNQANGWAAR